MAPDPEHVPVVVATGQSIERDTVVSVMDMATRAADAALSEVPVLRRSVDQVSVVNMLTNAGPAPAGRLARRLGLAPKRTEVTTIGGNSPQWLVTRAARAVATGEVGTVLVAGAEAQRSAQARRAGGSDRDGKGKSAGGGDGESEEARQLAPDPVVGDDRPGVGPAELAAGLIAPVNIYALFESAIARRAGHGFAQQRAAMARFMARFTDVAAKHPYAWFPESRTPAELAEITPDNRLVSDPYPKRMCAVLNVDQGAAVVVTSLAGARRAGVEDRAVFCLSGADASDVWFPTARPDPGASPAIGKAVSAALEAAGVGLDDVGLLDLYSCFPCAVEMAADAIGLRLDDTRGLTVTGGLPYFGGPGNNYTLHAIATMVEEIRAKGGIGFVTGLGWYATKHSVGVYGSALPASFQVGDTTAAQQSIDASAVEVATEGDGPAVVVAATLSMGPGGSVSAAPVIAALEDGRHIAAAAHETELAALAGRNLVGERIVVSGSPPRYHVGQ